MSSNVPRPQAQQALCEICHQRPKYGGHPYCSKTCAADAAKLCSHCHQKPKFGNFEYCGKHCATQAQKTAKPQQTQAPVANVAQTRAQIAPSAPAANVNKNTTQPGKKQPRSVNVSAPQVTFQPQQVQAVPPPPPPKNTTSWVKNAAAQIPLILSNSTNASQKAPPPFTNTVSHKSLPQLTVPGSSSASNAATAADPTQPTMCALPGCDEYAYVDPEGRQTSDYCSMSHREEAVEHGLVSPCIMCLTLPQGNVDHFCGRACREEALSKPLKT